MAMALWICFQVSGKSVTREANRQHDDGEPPVAGGDVRMDPGDDLDEDLRDDRERAEVDEILQLGPGARGVRENVALLWTEVRNLLVCGRLLGAERPRRVLEARVVNVARRVVVGSLAVAVPLLGEDVARGLVPAGARSRAQGNDGLGEVVVGDGRVPVVERLGRTNRS